MPGRWGSDTILHYIEEAEFGIKLARGIGGTAVAQEEKGGEDRAVEPSGEERGGDHGRRAREWHADASRGVCDLRSCLLGKENHPWLEVPTRHEFVNP